MTHCSSGDVHDKSAERERAYPFICAAPEAVGGSEKPPSTWLNAYCRPVLLTLKLMSVSIYETANLLLYPFDIIQRSPGDTEAADVLRRRESIKTFVFVDGTGRRDSLPGSVYLQTPAEAARPDCDGLSPRPAGCFQSALEISSPSGQPGPGLWT